MSPLEGAFVLAMVMVGAFVQSLIGFGFVFTAGPALLLTQPQAVPVTLLLLFLPSTLVMAVRERRAIDRRGFAWMTAGRIPGTLAGLAMLIAVPSRYLLVAFGVLILLAVLMSVAKPRLEVRDRNRFLAGILGGVMGTAAGIGSPPLALLYQGRPGAELRGTLSVSFAVGILISLAALGLGGLVERADAYLALTLLPAVLVGYAASRLALSRLGEERWLRSAVLVFAAASAVVVIAQGLAS